MSMVFSNLLRLLLFSLIPSSAATLNATILSAELRSCGLSPNTEIFLPSDPNFENETTQRYTTYDAPTYILSVKPVLEVDVQKIVKFASTHNISFLATGGGHGFATTFRNLQNGIEIDLGFFKNVSVDEAASTMTVGGAVVNGDVIEPLYAAGKELQTGSSACVGLVGSTLGGGVGRYNGLHGMIADSLLSADLVTAAGELISVSASENDDLYWGLRGAGMNYGIVVSATYEVYNLTNAGQVMNADFLFPLNESTAIFDYFKSLETRLPAELALIFQTGYNIAYGGTYIVVNAAYAGSMEEGLPLIQPLIDSHPTLQNITMVTWNNLLSSAFFGTAPKNAPCVKGTDQIVYGVGIKTYDIPTFDAFFTNLQTFFLQYPAAQSSVFFIEAFPNQAVKAVADNATAYPHRNINAHLLFNFGVTDPSLETIVNDFGQQARSNFSANSGFDALEVYVSYGHGDEGPIPLYAERKLPQLRALKEKWDPSGIFNFDEPFGA